MSIVAYSKQNEFDLVNSGQDCMGWSVVDQAGDEIGKVTEMLIETGEMKVDSIMVTGGVRVAAEDIALRDGRVVVRGVHDREEYQKTVATTATAPAAESYAAMQNENRQAGYVSGVTRAGNEGETTIPILEEQLQVGKRTVESGGARIRTNIEEVPVEQQVNLREEHVHVERREVNRPATEADFTAFKEGEMEIVEHAEVPVVAKEARVVEEVGIGKQVEERDEVVSETVRRTEVEVERTDGETAIDEASRRTANS